MLGIGIALWTCSSLARFVVTKASRQAGLKFDICEPSEFQIGELHGLNGGTNCVFWGCLMMLVMQAIGDRAIVSHLSDGQIDGWVEGWMQRGVTDG